MFAENSSIPDVTVNCGPSASSDGFDVIFIITFNLYKTITFKNSRLLNLSKLLVKLTNLTN